MFVKTVNHEIKLINIKYVCYYINTGICNNSYSSAKCVSMMNVHFGPPTSNLPFSIVYCVILFDLLCNVPYVSSFVFL